MRDNLEKRDRWTDRRLDLFDRDIVMTQCFDDAVLVRFEFILIDLDFLVAVIFQQFKGRVLIGRKVQGRVIVTLRMRQFTFGLEYCFLDGWRSNFEGDFSLDRWSHLGSCENGFKR